MGLKYICTTCSAVNFLNSILSYASITVLVHVCGGEILLPWYVGGKSTTITGIMLCRGEMVRALLDYWTLLNYIAYHSVSSSSVCRLVTCVNIPYIDSIAHPSLIAVAFLYSRMNVYGTISRTLRSKRNFYNLATTIRPNQDRVRNSSRSPRLASHWDIDVPARNYYSDKLGTMYEIRFKNSTPTSRYFAVYQKFPNTPGLKSIAWKVVGIPPNGTTTTQWTMDFGVAIANWQTGPPGRGIYTEQQIVPAKLGQGYKIVPSPDDGDIPMINPTPVQKFGKQDADLIKLNNSTPQKMVAGFALAGNLLAVEGLSGGETSNFVVHPTYFVATYHSIKPGMMVDAGAQLTPVKVEFDQGATIVEVEATVDAGIQKLVATTVL